MSSRRTITLAEMEQATGIARATIRMWERRYGAPVGSRDANGERVYTERQLQQMRSVAELVQMGHRPSVVLAASAAEVEQMRRAARKPASDADTLIDLLRRDGQQALLTELLSMKARVGNERMIGRLASSNVAVGAAWRRAQLNVFEEHAYTEAVQTALRHVIAELHTTSRPSPPRVVLGTFAGEAHGLGLLMTHAVLLMNGCDSVCLGVELPSRELAAAAAHYNADIVGVSVSAFQRTRKASQEIGAFAAGLASGVELWLGGSSPALPRVAMDNVRILGLVDIPENVATWRAARRTRSGE
jgi:MerR family transcriptional regulator, light-induced transcriptional regulator